uniref:Uncharacterized protein n=1 Tax=Leishmania RNA virus 1 TaxID=1678905 RepID=A0A2I4PCC8_9VIRU|nr:hypothetical protein Lg601047-1 [Leishmania RNA virus 1]
MPKSLDSLAVRMVALLMVHHGKALRASLNSTGIERRWGDQWPSSGWTDWTGGNRVGVPHILHFMQFLTFHSNCLIVPRLLPQA